MPDVIIKAIDKGVGQAYKDQFRVQVAAGENVTMTVAPSTTNEIWVAYSMVYGNIAEGAFTIYRSHSMIRRTYDPAWYSTGIGASYEIPLWLYLKDNDPLEFDITNELATAQYIDVSVFVLIVPKNLWASFKALVEREESIWDRLLSMLGGFLGGPSYVPPTEVPSRVTRDAPENPPQWKDEWRR